MSDHLEPNPVAFHYPLPAWLDDCQSPLSGGLDDVLTRPTDAAFIQTNETADFVFRFPVIIFLTDISGACLGSAAVLVCVHLVARSHRPAFSSSSEAPKGTECFKCCCTLAQEVKRHLLSERYSTRLRGHPVETRAILRPAGRFISVSRHQIVERIRTVSYLYYCRLSIEMVRV